MELSNTHLELYMSHLFRIIGQSQEHLITSYKMAAQVNALFGTAI